MREPWDWTWEHLASLQLEWQPLLQTEVICAALYYWFETNNPEMTYCPAPAWGIAPNRSSRNDPNICGSLFFEDDEFKHEDACWNRFHSIPAAMWSTQDLAKSWRVRKTRLDMSWGVACSPKERTFDSHGWIVYASGTTPSWTSSVSFRWPISTPSVVASSAVSFRSALACLFETFWNCRCHNTVSICIMIIKYYNI